MEDGCTDEARTQRTQTQTQVEREMWQHADQLANSQREMNEPHSHFSFIMVTNNIIAFLLSFSLSVVSVDTGSWAACSVFYIHVR